MWRQEAGRGAGSRGGEEGSARGTGSAPPGWAGAAIIHVQGGQAVLEGPPYAVRHHVLTVEDPRARFTTAFLEGRWDGRATLGKGDTFPVGLVEHVRGQLESLGARVEIRGGEGPDPVADGMVTADEVPGWTLWDHQVGAINAMLAHSRGAIRLPTASGKTMCAAVYAHHQYACYGRRTLLVTSRRDLVTQTVAFFRRVIGQDMVIGQAGDGIKDVGGAHVVVASGQCMLGREKRRFRSGFQRAGDSTLAEVVKDFEVLLLDECHHASSSSWANLAMASQACRRFGMSGTPLKGDTLADLLMVGATGPLIYDVTADALVRAGLCARPVIFMVMSPNASGPRLSGGVKDKGDGMRRVRPAYAEAYTAGIVENAHHNTAVLRATVWLVDQGFRVLVVTRRLAQFRRLTEGLEKMGVDYGAVSGATTRNKRVWDKEALGLGDIPVLVANNVLDEGTDIPAVDAMVLAEGVKTVTNVLQRIGRGMRRKEGSNRVIIVDFAPTCDRTLFTHAIRRCESYEAEGHSVHLVENWPKITDETWREQSLLPLADA